MSLLLLFTSSGPSGPLVEGPEMSVQFYADAGCTQQLYKAERFVEAPIVMSMPENELDKVYLDENGVYTLLGTTVPLAVPENTTVVLVPKNNLQFKFVGDVGQTVKSKKTIYLKSIDANLVYRDSYAVATYLDGVAPINLTNTQLDAVGNSTLSGLTGSVVSGFNSVSSSYVGRTLVIDGRIAGTVLVADTNSKQVLIDNQSFNHIGTPTTWASIYATGPFEFSLDGITWEKVLPLSAVTSTPIAMQVRASATIGASPVVLPNVDITIYGTEYSNG